MLHVEATLDICRVERPVLRSKTAAFREWQTYESTTKQFQILISDYQYSAELTGTINY